MNSQYLDRRPVSVAFSKICYYCDRRMQRRTTSNAEIPMQPQDRTLDHIHLKSRGSYTSAYPNGDPLPNFKMIWNKRPCCWECNVQRANFGHCCGVLMMVLMESRQKQISRESAARLLDVWPRQIALTRRQRRLADSVVYKAMRFGI